MKVAVIGGGSTYTPELVDGFARLEKFTRAIETRCAPEADFEPVVAHERAISKSLDGRVVGGKKVSRQMGLFE